MARNRYRSRGNIGEDTVTGTITGIVEPPPFAVKNFIFIWKNWLNNLSHIITDNVAQDWHVIRAVSTSVDGSTVSLGTVDQVILADPDSGALRIDLEDPAIDGLSHYIKNIDESGTYALTINPGPGTKIDGQPAGAAPASADATLAPLDSYHLVYDDVNETWWII